MKDDEIKEDITNIIIQALNEPMVHPAAVKIAYNDGHYNDKEIIESLKDLICLNTNTYPDEEKQQGLGQELIKYALDKVQWRYVINPLKDAAYMEYDLD